MSTASRKKTNTEMIMAQKVVMKKVKRVETKKKPTTATTEKRR